LLTLKSESLFKPGALFYYAYDSAASLRLTFGDKVASSSFPPTTAAPLSARVHSSSDNPRFLYQPLRSLSHFLPLLHLAYSHLIITTRIRKPSSETMASEQTLSTGDLRSRAQEYKRDSENKEKWANGESWGPGRQPTAHARPAKLVPRFDRNRTAVGTLANNSRRQKRSNKELGLKDAGLSQRQEILDEQYTSSDSSADESVVEPSAAPEPDAEVAYSFDAARGPSHGSQILRYGRGLVLPIEPELTH
jgi:hypothetical protein